MLAASQDELTEVATASLVSVVNGVLRVASVGANNATLIRDLTVPQSLLTIVARLAEDSRDAASGGSTRRVLAAAADSKSWIHDTVDGIGRAVSNTLLPGAPTVVISTPATTAGSALTVRFHSFEDNTQRSLCRC